MQSNRLEMQLHHGFKLIECVLCGVRHEEVMVGVALVWAGHTLGRLCPRCLELGPERLGELTAAHSSPLHRKGQAARTAVAAEIQKAEQANWQSLQASADAEQAVRHAAELCLKAQEVYLLAQALLREGGWSLRPAAVQQAERDALRTRFPTMKEEDVRRLVDERYSEFLGDRGAPNPSPNPA